MRNFYKLLGVPNDADEVVIKKAYKKLALIYHPDVNKVPDAQERFIEINEAYETLSDPNSRLPYDIALKTYYSPQQPIQPQVLKEKEKSGSNYYWIVVWLVFAALRWLISNISSNANAEHFDSQNTQTVLPSFMQDKKPKPSIIFTAPTPSNNNNPAVPDNTTNIFSGKPQEQ